jgi:RNase P/RNase MRP subunit POP5
MRNRRRYIAFELNCEANLMDVTQIVNLLRANSPRPQQPQLKLVLYDENKRRGMLRCGHQEVDGIKAALSDVREIGGKNGSFIILGVSGTVKAARRKFLAPSGRGKP